MKTIIFDLGGVLIKWDPKRLYRKIFDKEAEMHFFLENICTSDWNEQQDAGRPLEEAMDVLVVQHPEYETEIRAFYGRWPEMLGGPIEGTVQLLKELKASGDYRLYALTNWSAETFPIAIERYEFLTWFEGILVSGDEKMKKPDPAIYNLLLERYNIDRSTAVFIDDSLKNVKGAKAVELEAIHFQSPEQVKSELLDWIKS